MTYPLGPTAFPKVEPAATSTQRIDMGIYLSNPGKTWSHHYRDVVIQRFFTVLGARIADVKAGRPAEGHALDERIKKLQLERVELDVKQQEGRWPSESESER